MAQESRDQPQHADLDESARAQLERVAQLTPKERLLLLDRLCRELTHIAVSARER